MRRTACLGGVADALLEDRLHLHVLDVPQKALRDDVLFDADLDGRRHGVDYEHLSKPGFREHPRKNNAFCFPALENSGLAVDGRVAADAGLEAQLGVGRGDGAKDRRASVNR